MAKFFPKVAFPNIISWNSNSRKVMNEIKKILTNLSYNLIKKSRILKFEKYKNVGKIGKLCLGKFVVPYKQYFSKVI